MLQLYNTLTRRKEPFAPLEPGKASVYSCGPTVYRDVHIGNLRTYLLADWLRRLLEARGFAVTHVKNITDVGHMRQEMLDRGEDKVIAAALAAGKTPQQIVKEYTASFLRDEAALDIKPADVFPRATDHIPQMIEMTQELMKRGLAYEVEGNVYFSVERFSGYGKLSGNVEASLLEGVRAEMDPRKRDPRDFALWKATEPGRVMKWPSPWGEGFPGWHIECSAMSTFHLGPTFDIHTGGVDNIFPHHEDELAQSEGALGHQVVRYWMHGQHLLVDGLKMAKSTGNTYTLPDLQSRGFEPSAFRYLCAATHYRHRLNFTFDSLRAATFALNRLRQEAFLAAQSPDSEGGEEWESAFWDALEDDLHLPRALAIVWRMMRSETPPGAKARLLRSFDEVLMFGLFAPPTEVPAPVRALVDERQELRRRATFADADGLRERIGAAGFHVRDTRNDPAVVPAPAPPPAKAVGLHSSKDIPSWLEKPDELDFSLILNGRDDLDGLRRGVEAALRHAGDHKIEVIVVDNGSSDGTSEWLEELAARDERVRAIRCDHNLGVGAARNCGLRQARGRYVVLLDSSVELTGDLLSPLAEALEDGPAGIVGAFGVNTEDLRDFEDAPGPEVDAVEGYLMAFRRECVREVGLMDEKFRFYRHLDLDYSFAFREHGYRNRIVPDLPLRRHAHSDWERTPEEERDRLSKRNFYRFLKKHGDRTDLLLASAKK
ncbi:MAG: cysteine--tRNA ligase [Chloroflexi bacterium]|nr:cysteine--tRNA ligase [Chloroflexota bacterium]